MPKAAAYMKKLVKLLVIACILIPLTAFAEVEKALPYEEGLGILYNSLTGKVPFLISLVGIVACGAVLIFGGEITGFMRTLVFIVLVIAVIVQAAGVVSMLGGDNTFGAIHSNFRSPEMQVS